MTVSEKRGGITEEAVATVREAEGVTKGAMVVLKGLEAMEPFVRGPEEATIELEELERFGWR